MFLRFAAWDPPWKVTKELQKEDSSRKKKVEDDVSEMETIYMLNRVFLYSYVSGCNMV